MNKTIGAIVLGATLTTLYSGDALAAQKQRPQLLVDVPENAMVDVYGKNVTATPLFLKNLEGVVDKLVAAGGKLPETITVRVEYALRGKNTECPVLSSRNPGKWEFSVWLAPEEKSIGCEGYGRVAREHWSNGLSFHIAHEWESLNGVYKGEGDLSTPTSRKLAADIDALELRGAISLTNVVGKPTYVRAADF